MIETLIPSFIPEIKNARKVSFKKPEDIRDDFDSREEKEKQRNIQKQFNAYRMKLSRWRKEKVKAEKRVTRCEWFLNEALKALKGVEDAKPLPPVVGIPVFTELESLYVVEKKKIPSSPQSPSK